ncbi:iron-siderophore ABC transporter substrate-binding protein [Ancylobacter sp. SL191]|uniref:iron-siderophore ABC transporter substrate-binding protein n=1 Tax=Ancylobacter sp. SL191 TaxID=2995166 RepID=UPI00226DE42B|nr:iron-siderophore ABC transporter substrate-binding protein [Ancylobacter sp. SL191]WAC26643.1 iron-siderophore ABC transporter substrate-binding protein [Ancylobacter sp. SL191]
MIRPLATLTLGLALLGMLGAPARACEGRRIESADILHAPVCVPTDPRRIVVLDPTFSLGMGLELELPLLGAPLAVMSDHALREKALARGVTDLGSFMEPSIERIVALQPDLILGTALADRAYPLLSQLAPTVLIDADNWQDYLRLVAEVAGRRERGEQLLEGYRTRVAHLKSRVPDRSVSVVRITPWDFQVYLDGPKAYGPFAVLRDVGVRRSAYETTGGDETLKRPDWEALAGLNGETLLYIVGGVNNSATSGRHEEVLANPLWQMLPAVKAGRVHRLDPAVWMEFSGVGSAHRVLDDVERLIIAQP